MLQMLGIFHPINLFVELEVSMVNHVLYDYEERVLEFFFFSNDW